MVIVDNTNAKKIPLMDDGGKPMGFEKIQKNFRTPLKVQIRIKQATLGKIVPGDFSKILRKILPKGRTLRPLCRSGFAFV